MVPVENAFLPKITWPNSGRARNCLLNFNSRSFYQTKLAADGVGVRREALNCIAKADIEV